MVRRAPFVLNVCECCGGEIFAWVPLPTTDHLMTLPECLECGLMTCMMCRVDHVLGHDHQACNRGRAARQ